MSDVAASGAGGPGGMLPFRRVLVTGASGFVGCHLLPRLRAALGPDARLWRAGRAAAGEECGAPATFVEFDLADARTIDAAIAGVRPDLIVHLAGEASVGGAATAAASAWRRNASGALDLAAAIATHSPEVTLLNVSSAEVYGRAFLDGVATEARDPLPNSVYARSKLAAEEILHDALPGASRLIVVRPSNHIGPGQDRRFAIPSFAEQIAMAERARAPATIRVGNLSSQRDFMDVRDVVEAYLTLLAQPLAPGARTMFNLSSGTVRSVESLLALLRDRSTIQTHVEIDPKRFREAEIPVAALDSTNLRKETGWLPTIPIERTITDVLEDCRGRQGE